MARTVRDQNLETRSARARLKPSPKPYYRSIDPGLHLGYRRGKNGGRWVVRWYVGDQDYKTETIANADDVADADGVAILNFAQAQQAAREMRSRAARIAAGIPIDTGPYTVKQCINEYLAWMEQHRKGAKDARYRAEALVIPKLGATECEKLRAGEVRTWLRDVANAPARIRGKKGSGPRFRVIDDKDEDAIRRRRASANRTLTILKAALNMAWREGKIASDDAWRRVSPFEQADAARVRYLQVDEARRLINASDPDFRALVRMALATGARFGELANLRVGDFNPDSGTVHVRASKSGQGRHIVLTDEGVQHLDVLCTGRPANDWILIKNDGGRWLERFSTGSVRNIKGFNRERIGEDGDATGLGALCRHLIRKICANASRRRWRRAPRRGRRRDGLGSALVRPFAGHNAGGPKVTPRPARWAAITARVCSRTVPRYWSWWPGNPT
jgi:integrase